MNESKRSPIVEDWKHIDRKVLKASSILLVLIIAIILALSISLEANTMTAIASLQIVPVIIFPALGIIAFKYYKKGMIPNKIILKWFVILSLPSGMAAAIPLLLLEVMPKLPESITFLEFLGVFSSGFFGMFCAALLFQIIIFIFGFGVVWLFSAIGRHFTPGILIKIKGITSEKSNSFQQKLLRWIFNIPDIVDTKTLTIYQGERKKIFPWSTYKKAIIWEMYLGILLVLYISLNPLLLESIDFGILVNMVQYLLIVPPIIVMAWLIYSVLDARIRGPIKDFKLYDGLRQRMFQTVIAFSTIIVFVQAVIRNPDFALYVWATTISFLFLIFFAIVLIFSFIYFNYFEYILARDISDDFAKKENSMSENVE